MLVTLGADWACMSGTQSTPRLLAMVAKNTGQSMYATFAFIGNSLVKEKTKELWSHSLFHD